MAEQTGMRKWKFIRSDLVVLALLLFAALFLGCGRAQASSTITQTTHWTYNSTTNLMTNETIQSACSGVRPRLPKSRTSIRIYNRIASAVTVYSGRGRVDESTAPLLALEAMPDMDRLSAEAIISRRNNLSKDRYKMSTTQQFKVGDIVVLKSGGPRMTVTYVDNEGPQVECMWFVGTKRDSDRFPSDALFTPALRNSVSVVR